MAGGKETPRQKMIGMMYLVLTALLALNISNAVLEKFAVLNNTLGELRDEASAVNSKTAAAILAAASTADRVKEAKKRAQQVREATDKVIADLDDYKVKLSQEHDGTEIPMEELILNTNIAEEKMLSSTKPEFGRNFEKILVDYSARIKEITRLDLPKLNRKAVDYKEFKDNPHLNIKDFIHFQFEGTPTMAAITSITQMQTEILENEAMALDTIAKVAEIGVMKVDNYVPMVIPESDIVAAGSKYKARMFVAASSSGLIPTMKQNGASVAVAKDPETNLQMGSFEFTAIGGNYDKNNLAEKSFNAEITLKSPDTTIKRIIKYRVIKPVIKITTGNLPQLYYNCGNLVNIEVPSLGTNYQPNFTGKGATIVPSTKVGQVTIIPKEMKVVITVNNSGAFLGTEEFAVKRIPRPHITRKDQNNKEIDPKMGIKSTSQRQIRVSVEPDDTFKENVPKDAIYRVKSMEACLRRGVNCVSTKTVSSEIIDISDWQMRPGDVIVCNIKAVNRMTYLKEEEKIDPSSYDAYQFISVSQ